MPLVPIQAQSSTWAEHTYPRLPASQTDPWFAGKEFTSDWVAWKLGLWSVLARQLSRNKVAILEIGSWEGRSAITWLNLLPNSTITCIDRWWKMPDHERRFDQNLRAYGGRVTKIRSESGPALETLVAQGALFDLIYVDGDHRREPALRDTLLAWQMLRRNGILLWDDYEWEPERPSKDRPQEAIDWFLQCYKGEIEVLHIGFQVAVRRVGYSAMQKQRSMRLVNRLKRHLRTRFQGGQRTP